MKTIRFRWKHWLLLFTVLVMTATLVAACQPAEEVEEKPTITFSDTWYESVWLANAVAGFILEEGYGYPVETVQASVAVTQVSLSKGDIHVWLDCWWWYYLYWYNEAIANGEIENLGPTMEP